MNIIFVTASMVGGGSERVIAALSDQFTKEGHKVTILMTASSEVAYKLNPQVDIKNIGGKTNGSLLKRVERIKILREHFKRGKNEVVISFGTEANMFCILAGLGTKKKIILSERNDPNQCTFKLLRNFIYSLEGAFVFQTEDAMRCFSKCIQRRSIIIPNPILSELPKEYEGKREKNIVAVGRLTVQKNHALLIRAFENFLKNQPDYELIIYGKGELLDELKQLTVELDISDKVIFAGFANDVLERIKKSSAYILSSDYEGISNSLLEAMAIGLPVISTDCPIGGSRFCIANEVNGILVPMNNVNKMAEAMIRVVEDQELSARIGRKAIEVRNDFAIEKIAKMWLEAIRKVE